ncbi:MAG: GHKL domain-containing protein [Desulfohalobiaceae bacterium]|nr:GHKL domain-containing protein [Desulfohalobiaceae bacterium]
MKRSLYSSFRRKMVLMTFVIACAPMVLLGWVMSHDFFQAYRQRIEEQLVARANSFAPSLNSFLSERMTILTTIARTYPFDYLADRNHLEQILGIIDLHTGGLVDLGLIDARGLQVAYVGPYQLQGLNYEDQKWFDQVLIRGTYRSDVFLGYRQLPHFVIAVKSGQPGKDWILRATIDSKVFSEIVQKAQVGRSGNAFILNSGGVFQTPPRFAGDKLLDESGLDPEKFGQNLSLLEEKNAQGQTVLYCGAWLEGHEWLLVVSQTLEESLVPMIKARKQELLLFLLIGLGVLAAAVVSIRMNIRQLQKRDREVETLNAQLVQADKMAALGRMAAGVAHEINNPLGVILEKTGWMKDLLLEESFQESQSFQEYDKSLDKIEEHVDRARKVTHNLLGFARKMEPRQEQVDVNDVLKQTVELLEYHAKNSNIAIHQDLGHDIPLIPSDQSQLQQVFLNLLNNAIDAIGKNGEISIKTMKTGTHVCVWIDDNGPGVPREIMNSLFDPFVTTKEKGTGLGLSIVHTIITRLGGEISVNSEPGKGTSFRIMIPMNQSNQGRGSSL